MASGTSRVKKKARHETWKEKATLHRCAAVFGGLVGISHGLTDLWSIDSIPE